MKKLLISFTIVSALVLGAMGSVANAGPCLAGSGGGTGICAASSTSQNYYVQVSSTTPTLTYVLSPVSGGGSTTTINGISGPAFQLNSTTYIGIMASGTAFTFTNSGVTSFNGATGSVTYSPTASVGPATSTYVAYFNSSSTVIGTSSFTYASTTGLVTLQSLNGFEYAVDFSGSDAAAQIQNAYAALPSNGGTIYAPCGSFNVTTNINFSTFGKPVMLIGCGGSGLFSAGGTTLIYTAATGTLFTYSAQKFSTAGVGIENMSLVGPAGVGGTGAPSNPSNTTSTLGILLTGVDPNGATGFLMNGVQISGFGKGMQWGPNTFITNVQNSVINNNGMNIYMPAAINAFENDKFTNDLFGNCNASSGASSSNCIYINPNISADITFSGDDFDTSQIALISSATGNVILHIFGSHFENAGVANVSSSCYAFITTSAGQAKFVTVYSSGNTYLFNGAVGGNCPELVNNGANFISSGDTISSYGDNTTSTITFVNNQDAVDTVSWNGLNQTWVTNSSQNSYVYGTNNVTAQGFGMGSNLPVYSISTSTVQFGNQTNINTTNPVGTASDDFLVGDASSSLNVPVTFFHKTGSSSSSLTGFGINTDLTAGAFQNVNTSTNGYVFIKDSRNGASSTNLLLEQNAATGTGTAIIDQWTPTGAIIQGGVTNSFVYANGSGQLVATTTPQGTILRGVSNTLGGSLLSGVGTCIEATGTVTGILPGMSINASPATTTDIGDGLAIRAWASAANQATVELCSLLATITPVATTYQFSAIP